VGILEELLRNLHQETRSPPTIWAAPLSKLFKLFKL
jgi:hypothetical protein